MTELIHYTDRREHLIKLLEDLKEEVEDGEIQAIAVVQLNNNGTFKCHESFKNNTDRLALVGATQVLSQHIMAGE